MSLRKTKNGCFGFVSRTIVAVLLFLIFMIIIAAAISFLTGNNLTLSSPAALRSPTPNPDPTSTIILPLLSTPDAPATITFRSVALGFALEYPEGWRKKENTLEAIFSPSLEGLEVSRLMDSSIRVGIPTDDNIAPSDLLARLLADFPHAKTLDKSPLTIGAQGWASTQISFIDEELGEQGMATIATTSRNEVGYFVVAVAPADEWAAIQPAFQEIIRSFRFTAQAVLQPTNATPPPTPTPTPTPIIYVVQPGDTLSGIAANFGVTVEGLATRNGIDKPESLRSGQRLLIPTKRR